MEDVQHMKKILLVKIIKETTLILFALGFFLPFIVGRHMGINFSHSVFNLEALPPNKSYDILVYIFFMITAGSIFLMIFVKKLNRIVYLSTFGIGVILLVVLYVQTFQNLEIKGFIRSGDITTKIGIGLYFQMLIILLGVVIELFGYKIFDLPELKRGNL
jgi:hypothetical protein